MTSEQYQSLLRELARVGGLADASALLDGGCLKIGELDVLLEHEPGYDPELLQVRALLGGFPEEQEHIITKALLQANYASGYGGECVFSLLPESDDVVLTMKMRLDASLSAQELWQSLSDIARHGTRMWKTVISTAGLSQNVLPTETKFAQAHHI